MSKEKIAFVLPVYDNTPEGKNRPLLVFTAEELPAVTEFHFAVFLLGLTNEEEYWLSPTILYCGDDGSVHQIHAENGTWIRAKTVIGSDNNVATAINLHFNNAKFDEAGQYVLRVSLSDKNKLKLHENQSFFEVMKSE